MILQIFIAPRWGVLRLGKTKNHLTDRIWTGDRRIAVFNYSPPLCQLSYSEKQQQTLFLGCFYFKKTNVFTKTRQFVCFVWTHRWPSGLRRYVQVVVSPEAWVRTPLDAINVSIVSQFWLPFLLLTNRNITNTFIISVLWSQTSWKANFFEEDNTWVVEMGCSNFVYGLANSVLSFDVFWKSIGSNFLSILFEISFESKKVHPPN